MVSCASCGGENPEGARFCNACGAALEERLAAAEERKLVSVLFVDLVGFTARSDAADPEDVRAMLRPYHARVRQEIDRFGGTIEKFIGDAVMAVFGAPVAHEDDAERAVRAALGAVESIVELNEQRSLDLSVRAAVATGEAVVSLDARPGEGEGIATGDVVNVAARLQSEAPVGGVVVAEQTFRATRGAIEYEELRRVMVKGKAEPLPLWLAVRARSRLGDYAEPARATPFVGRDHEIRLLRETFERTLRESTIQLVTITGEPGVGKTRLLREFRDWVDNRPEVVYWRQGRCLPYGDGIAFWALGEIVKAHAGILESDGPEEAASKLRASVATVVDERDRDWLVSSVAPLVGLDFAAQSTRDESFAAWQALLEGVAAQRPLILLFEDLHWGDAALLDFVDRLVDWSTGAPILVLCTARPELYDLRPGWGGGKRDSTTISVSPLTRDDIARLVSALLDAAVLPSETQEALLERAGGNPLYAEEYVRLFRERGSTEGLTLPETLQALIAARIDALPAERKALLHDASVIGKVFWAGALPAIGNVSAEDVRAGLQQLAQRELVRRMRTSSVEGHSEYAFWHALVRDVAYAQIPRASRAAKHRAAADWIEEMAGERLADHAELVAHHLSEAIALGRAAGDEHDADLEARAARRLVLAGDRSANLDAQRAEQLYRRALELVSDSVEHPRILAKAADAAFDTGKLEIAANDLAEAAERLEAAGDVVRAGRAFSQLARIYFALGGADRMERALTRALALLERVPAGPELVETYARMVQLGNLQGGRREQSLAWAEKAIDLAEHLGWKGRALANARVWRGFVRCELGDLDGLSDLETGFAETLESEGSAFDIRSAYATLGDIVWRVRGPLPALEVMEEGAAYLDRRGVAPAWLRAEACWMLYDLGRWDELVRAADEIRLFSDAHGSGQPDVIASTYRAFVFLQRGATAEAAALLDYTLPHARQIEDPQVVGPALVAAALVAMARGDRSSAGARIEEWDPTTRERPFFRSQNLTDAVRVACAIGDVDLAERLRERVVTVAERDRLSDLTAQAAILEARGEAGAAFALYDKAASGWKQLGCRFEQGLAITGGARCRKAAGRSDEVSKLLEEAEQIFTRLRARPPLAALDDLHRAARTATTG